MTIALRQRPLHRLVQKIASDNNGAWFDPEDLSTMFQDAAGTTPVTAMEQPVGLWLDKSQGLELGPELVKNGDFSNGTTGWSTSNATLDTSQQNALITNTTTSEGLLLVAGFNAIAGKTYEFSATVLGNSNSGAITIGGTRYGLGGNGIKKLRIKAINTTGCAISTNNTTVGAYLRVDNISVREIKGNHATQSITASRPTLSARYNLLLNSATLSTQSVTTAAAQYTLSFTGTGSVTLSGTATGTLVGTGANNRVSLAFTPTAGTLTLTVTGSVTLAMLAFGTLTTYQAITTATSYDSAGWNRYVRFDGIDDYLNLPYMGLYANGSASVVVGRVDTKSSGTVLSEGNSTNNTPVYWLLNRDVGTAAIGAYIRNLGADVLIDTRADATGYLNGGIAINSMIDTGSTIYKYTQSVLSDRDAYLRSGTLPANNTIIGAVVRTSASGYLRHNNYGLIITKSALSDTDRRRCEQFLAGRLSTLGVTLS